MQKTNEKDKPPYQKGLVISYHGNSVAVETANGQVIQCHLRRNQVLPVVGDRVDWTMEGADAGVVLGIEPRHSTLGRGDARGNMKPIAANVDVILVVMSPTSLSEQLIDRYLVAAEVLKIAPVIMMNKVDLLNQSDKETVSEKLKIYRDIPYPVMMTSAKTSEGLDQLTSQLKNKVAVLVGPSGVGKSSIITALTGDSIRTTEVSDKGAGKHTTTATRYYHLPKGGGLIDSPGVRDFSLWAVGRQAVFDGFREFKPFLTGCKFRDCQHLVEPGCAIREATAEGKIHAERFESYLALIKEADEEANKNKKY